MDAIFAIESLVDAGVTFVLVAVGAYAGVVGLLLVIRRSHARRLPAARVVRS